ncbi:high-potential iron-sulfur protein [Caballeronia sp. dw_276]|jgi:hypothetical protein|uniref:high-potential iron-sulfur protein n=1 Tax=Caballeronia sp. dw_276 TaxID=2719795 RepID=UPI001BD46237|nr:high-potential iron-sulfur protein [Caballeronia sp. dw_276]
MQSSRRTFLISSIGMASALAVSRTAFADPVKLPETDPMAKSLGYKENAATVDKAKFPRYAAGQDCGNCSFYQAKATEPYAACPMFAGKQVASKGWCNAYNKRA